VQLYVYVFLLLFMRRQRPVIFDSNTTLTGYSVATETRSQAVTGIADRTASQAHKRLSSS